MRRPPAKLRTVKARLRVTAERVQSIHRLRGILKGKLGDRFFAEWRSEQKREELALEETKLLRSCDNQRSDIELTRR